MQPVRRLLPKPRATAPRQDYDVTITVTYQTTLTVTAADEDHARDQASSIMNDRHQFPSTVYTGNYSLTEQDWDIQDAGVS